MERQQSSFYFQVFHSIEELSDADASLLKMAKDATSHAYAPYSKFCVGAALVLDDGTIISGSNQENAAYPLCMCAERVALYAASSLHPDKKIMKMAVVAHKKNHKDLTPATCCGSCRQVLVEFESRQNKPIELIMLGPDHKWIKAPSAASTLPLGFSKESLDI